MITEETFSMKKKQLSGI
ncbi:hypothetical protein [Amedibacterium intestinale]